MEQFRSYPSEFKKLCLVLSKIVCLNLLDRPMSSVFNCDNYKTIRFITWLRVGLSHLRERSILQNCLHPVCSCLLPIEPSSHFLLHCPIFNDEIHLSEHSGRNLFKLVELTNSFLSQALLYGDTLFNKEKKTLILNTTMESINPLKDLKRPESLNSSRMSHSILLYFIIYVLDFYVHVFLWTTK